MLPVDDFEVISAAHFHLLRFLLKQDLAAQLVKHNGVHLWPRGPAVSLVRKKKTKKRRGENSSDCSQCPSVSPVDEDFKREHVAQKQ